MKAAAHVYQRMRGWQHERQNVAFSSLRKMLNAPRTTAVTTGILHVPRYWWFHSASSLWQYWFSYVTKMLEARIDDIMFFFIGVAGVIIELLCWPKQLVLFTATTKIRHGQENGRMGSTAASRLQFWTWVFVCVEHLCFSTWCPQVSSGFSFLVFTHIPKTCKRVSKALN